MRQASNNDGADAASIATTGHGKHMMISHQCDGPQHRRTPDPAHLLPPLFRHISLILPLPCLLLIRPRSFRCKWRSSIISLLSLIFS